MVQGVDEGVARSIDLAGVDRAGGGVGDGGRGEVVWVAFTSESLGVGTRNGTGIACPVDGVHDEGGSTTRAHLLGWGVMRR